MHVNQKSLSMLKVTDFTDSSEGTTIAPIKLLEFFGTLQGEAPTQPDGSLTRKCSYEWARLS